jgi:glutamine amidotransferase-like uncharacterized protein
MYIGIKIKGILSYAAFIFGTVFFTALQFPCFGDDLIIAIYDDTTSIEPSAWSDGLDYIEQALKEQKIVTIRITREELNTDSNILQNIDAFIFGGGYAYPGYTFHITKNGKNNIKEYITNGGIFVGICAGAYFACSQINYEGQDYDDESGYNLDLYPGTGFGPLTEIASYPEWGLAIIEIEQVESLNTYIPLNSSYYIWYGGGPYFTDLPAGAIPLATYINVDDNHKGYSAVICQSYGNGKVILWGPHPEVLGEPASSINRKLFVSIILWAIEQ